ncbi:MAG: type II toxin-antitoxin system CcdA family antitoxin [Pseudonocardiaceae bacterium]
MPKVSIYLPDALYREAQARKLHLSALAQQAIESAVRESARQDWITKVRSRPPRCHTVIDTAAVLTEVREELGQ